MVFPAAIMEFYGHNLLGRLCKKKEDKANQDKGDKDKKAKKDKSDVQQDKSDGAKKGKTDGAQKDKRKQDKRDKKDKKHKMKTNGDVTGSYLAGHMVKSNSMLAPYKNRSRRRTRSNGKDDVLTCTKGSEVN